MFANHVVLQFTILNTIDDQRLKDVRVDVDVSDSDAYSIQSVVIAPLARYGTYAKVLYVHLRTFFLVVSLFFSWKKNAHSKKMPSTL